MTIYQGTKIREVAPLADIHLIKTQHSPSPVHIIPVFLDIDLTESPISLTQKQWLLALLQKYSDLFVAEDKLLGRTSAVKHAIHTECPPIHQPVHRQHVALQDAISVEVQKMLQQKVIQPT